VAKGALAIVLHAHLPFVRQTEHDRFLEENWLFEAIIEVYLPLIQALQRMRDRGVPAVINLSISPPLLHMLQDELLMQRFSHHFSELEALAKREIQRRNPSSEEGKTAEFYRRRIGSLKNLFEIQLNGDLLNAWKELAEDGYLELFTCVGTHPYLPAIETSPQLIDGHFRTSIEAFQRAFNKKPAGIWLPECAYVPALRKPLEKYNLRYFIMETHGVLLGQPKSPYGVFSGLGLTAKLSAFAREQASSRDVWSRQWGYPGHPDYREFYHDLSQDADKEHLSHYFFAAETPIHTGFKYKRITGEDEKRPYQPFRAQQLAREHARHFVQQRLASFDRLAPHMEQSPIIVAPYDAELFGHWWYEGPEFLEGVCEDVAAHSHSIRLVSLSEAQNKYTQQNNFSPAVSSWGEGGFGQVWINDKTDWIYPELHKWYLYIRKQAAKRSLSKLQKDILNQMTRELLLAQASDWPFMIYHGSSVEYAERQIKNHLANLEDLAEDLALNKGEKFSELREVNNIFPWIDYRWFI
jgi:1,4-alpha-glucan branching enzyme